MAIEIQRSTLVLLLVTAVPCLALEVPEWLPPPPVRAPFWDEPVAEQIMLPADDFIRMLEGSRSTDPATGLPRTGRRKESQEADFEIFRWKAKYESADLRELREDPAIARDWLAEQSLNLPLPLQDSLFMFGQFASGGDVERTQRHASGRTGLGVKWSPFSGSELQVRTGPVVKYSDDLSSRTFERSQLSVEMQAKMDLLGALKLQYAGEALPSFAQTDRHQLMQDLKVAMPFGDNREVSVGARYRWEETLNPTPWMQRAEIYMGLKLQR